MTAELPVDPALSIDPDCAAAWSDYRKDYGVPQKHLSAAFKAFKAGWLAAREGDQSGVLR